MKFICEYQNLSEEFIKKYIKVLNLSEILVSQKLSEHLEYADGRMKIKGLLFCYVPLEMAMKNKHHDEEGFWERWAENF